MTILIADDQPINLKLLRAILEAEGHNVKQAEDGMEALSILGREPVDAIISDILMPRMDGYRLCSEVRRDLRFGKIPFIFYTATYNSPADEKLCYDLGADKYLRKPATGKVILEALDSVTNDSAKSKAPAPQGISESHVMKQYNEQLVLKLEEKNHELLASIARLDLTNRALAAAANAILITDDDGVIEWVNPSFSKLTGYNFEETIGKKTGELLRSGKHDRSFYGQLWETIQAGNIWHGEMHNRKKDGTIYPEEMTITPVINETGKITHFIAVKQDISDRIAAQEALRLENERFKRFAETNIAGIVVGEADGSLSFANDYYLNLLGVKREDFHAGTVNWKAFTPPEWISSTDKVLHDLREYGVSKPFEKEYIRTDGERVSVFIANALLPGKEGQVAGVVLDITEQKRAQNNLHESELRFRQIAENIREIFYLVDPKMSEVFYISPAYKEIFGRTCESLYDNPASWGEAIHPDDRDRVFREITLQGTLIAADTEYRIVRPDGHIRSIRARLFPIADRTGEIFRFAGTAEDITQQKQVELQLRQSQKMEAIGQLSGGVAHDFNNLLTVIMGHTALLEEVTVNGQGIDSISEIKLAAERAANLTRQLLLFARKQTMQMKNLDLNPAIAETIKMLTRIVGEDIQLEFKLAPGELQICADAGMLDQILLNLAVNARDAMPKGGKLFIETARAEFGAETAADFPQIRAGKFASISVTDTGSGIPADVLPKIFEPFFTTKDVDKGTGLGLATVFGIAQQHGGWINVYSEVGQGSVFRVFLPLVEGDLHSHTVSKTKPIVKGGNETILLVEDEPSIRLLLSNYLTQLGYTVISAGDGREAVKIFADKSGDIGLVLTGLVMPGGVSGTELAGILKTQKANLRIIFSSGYSNETISRGIKLTEGVNFLAKPFNLADVAKTIRAQLDLK